MDGWAHFQFGFEFEFDCGLPHGTPRIILRILYSVPGHTSWKQLHNCGHPPKEDRDGEPTWIGHSTGKHWFLKKQES